jgi:hypothetical protein
VEHALPPVTLRVEHAGGETLHLEVSDGGPSEQPGAWTMSCDADEHGRGGTIIDFLASGHGRKHDWPGTTHWVDLRLPP